MTDLDKYHCDRVICDGSKNNIMGISAIIQHSDDIEDFFYIPFLNNGNGYYISMYSPKYIIEPEIKLGEDDKKDLIDLLNNGVWEELIDVFNEECGEVCSSIDCKHRFKKLPTTPPDYSLL